MGPIDGSMSQRRASKWPVLGFALRKTVAQATVRGCVNEASCAAVPDDRTDRILLRGRPARLVVAPSIPVCSRRGWEIRSLLVSACPSPAATAAATGLVSQDAPPSPDFRGSRPSAGQRSNRSRRRIRPSSREGRTMCHSWCRVLYRAPGWWDETARGRQKPRLPHVILLKRRRRGNSHTMTPEEEEWTDEEAPCRGFSWELPT